MRAKITIADLQQMKRDAQKIVAVVVYDYQLAQIVDRADVDIVSVGDSVGVNMWGQEKEDDVTVDEMLLACRAVRRGVTRAILSCDIPSSSTDVVSAARRLVDDGGADMVKVEASTESIRAIVDAGIPVWAQLSNRGASIDAVVDEAVRLQRAGASVIDFRHSGPDAGAVVAAAVSIPVIGGLGGGPWLDGRVRLIMNAIGYTPAALDVVVDGYANVARVALEAITSYAHDVRSGRQIKGK